MKIYEELDCALGALLDQSSAKTVAPFNGQYRNTENDTAKAYPANYYELLEPISFTQSGNQYQQAQVRARIHCVVYDLIDSKEKINKFAQETFELLNQKRLYYADKSELTTPLVRVASSLPKRYKNLKVIMIDVEFEAFDLSSTCREVQSAELTGFTISKP